MKGPRTGVRINLVGDHYLMISGDKVKMSPPIWKSRLLFKSSILDNDTESTEDKPLDDSNIKV